MCDEHKRNANGYWVQLWCVEKTESLSQLNPFKKNNHRKKSHRKKILQIEIPTAQLLNFSWLFPENELPMATPKNRESEWKIPDFPAININNQAFIVIRIMGFSRGRGTTGAEHGPWPGRGKSARDIQRSAESWEIPVKSRCQSSFVPFQWFNLGCKYPISPKTKGSWNCVTTSHERIWSDSQIDLTGESLPKSS